VVSSSSTGACWGKFKDNLRPVYSSSAGFKLQRLPALVYQPEEGQCGSGEVVSNRVVLDHDMTRS
jgi:hypothetical protein